MERRPLTQANSRLKLCKRAFEEVKNCHFEEDDFQTHWQDFLIQWKGTYMKVQQAAKSTPQEVQWFGSINNFRRKDPLLRWLYEARNDEEHHGLSDSAIRRPAHYRMKIIRGGPRTARVSINAPGDVEMVDKDTGEVVGELESYEPQVSELREVTEKDGKKKVPPPTHHFGHPIRPDPKIAAFLGLRWISALVLKAEEMSRPSK